MVALGGGAITVAADPRAAARRVVHRAPRRLAADGVAADRGPGRRPPARRRGARVRRALRAAAAPLYHATADALVDAEEVQRRGGPAGAAGAARARWPSCAACRRAAGGARGRPGSVLRVLGPPIEPFVTVRLPAGEAAKTVAVARQAWTRLAELGVERGDVIVGLGGGAATDVAGFVAATYHRGIPWIAVPTSLMGMVDAGIGGKTGRRPAAGQERGRGVPPAGVGGVRPGDASRRCRCGNGRAGFAEVSRRASWPAGGCGSSCASWEPGRGSPERAARADPPLRGLQGADRGRRPRGARAAGGAQPRATPSATRSRSATGYKAFSHGEAVGDRAARRAVALGAVRRASTRPSRRRCASCCARHGLPVAARNVSPAAVIDAMAHDKKARGGRVRFALLEDVGKPVWGIDPGDELIEKAVARAVARRVRLRREPDRDAHDVRRPAAARRRVDDDDRPVLGGHRRGRGA